MQEGLQAAISYFNNPPNRTKEWNDSSRTAAGNISYLIEYDTLPDIDRDGATEAGDNCQFVANPDQADGDADGIGKRRDADLNNDCGQDLRNGTEVSRDPLQGPAMHRPLPVSNIAPWFEHTRYSPCRATMASFFSFSGSPRCGHRFS